MKTQFAGKSALVTGSSQGIGLAVARTLAQRGASVVINYPNESEQDKAQAAVQEIRASGGAATAVLADVTSVSQITRLFDEAEAAYGPLHFVISNVGGTSGFTRFADVDEALWQRTTDLTAKSMFFVLKEAGQRVRDHGRIVGISSSTVRMPYAGVAVYAGAKAAVEVYCKTLAKEVGFRGVTVNCVAPGLTLTEGVGSYGVPPERFEQLKQATPLGRLARSQDIADTIMTVLSDDAHWLTGQFIPAAGGLL
ncbi:SDR family oxidoreductase [Pusillimonas caeni]|uniref:SDR family oxidoreductase n=1 Tax=Pusillimonas caeni TaxID=1348472 RepID=UPI00142FA083|nr:SDR family oxidoreductase [Pusillimonas caeni]